jgi:hypothetical protein
MAIKKSFCRKNNKEVMPLWQLKYAFVIKENIIKGSLC